MPIYEYACQKCGEFEVTQRISDPSLKKCPTCGAKVTKLISSTAFHLKGSGWYATDYARDKPSKGGGEDKKPTTGDTKDGGAPGSPSTGASSPPAKESSAKDKESAAA